METLKEHSDKKTAINQNVRKILTYIGYGLTIVFSIVYVIILLIMIYGFEAKLNFNSMILVATFSAVFTFAITMSLLYQGILFAKQGEEVSNINIAYENAKNKIKKQKKIHTITHYIILKTITNVLFKAGTIFLSTYLIINIVIVGLGDVMLLWLGISNILMAVGFGLLSLVGSYDYYIEKHIPAILEKTRQLEELKQKPSGVRTTDKE